MTASADRPRLAVLGPARDYAARLSRARWRRAVGAAGISQVDPARDAAAAFAGAAWWVVLIDEAAIPVEASGARPPAGRVLGASAVEAAWPVHTLRELEEAAGAAVVAAASPPPAISFAPAETPPAPDESAGEYLARLRAACRPEDRDPRFRALRVPDASANARPELARLVPAAARRLLDVGCGSGGFAEALKRERPGLFVLGIENDGGAAERARSRLDRVVVADARDAVGELAEAGERFDAIVCADVLEHLDDAPGLLEALREVAAPGAVLIVSVPNVGHVSLVRDLLRGRFDPVAAGLLDAGHLRWFDKTRLGETIGEAGWALDSLEGLPGAPAPGADEFLDWAAARPGGDRESLSTYQWMAVASAAGPSRAR